MSLLEPYLRQRGPVPAGTAAAWNRLPSTLRYTTPSSRPPGGTARNIARPVSWPRFGAHVARSSLPEG